MEGKRWAEIILMPLVLAALGSGATYFITRAQIDSSERTAAVERDVAERRARSDRQVKVLEIFSAKISSPNIADQQNALRLLELIEPALAGRIAQIIAKDESASAPIRQFAKTVVQSSDAQRGNAFAVIASIRDLDTAIGFARKIRRSLTDFPVHVYLAENDYYAVALGGNLSREDAARRVQIARERGIASDAYVWQSNQWGDNLFR